MARATRSVELRVDDELHLAAQPADDEDTDEYLDVNPEPLASMFASAI